MRRDQDSKRARLHEARYGLILHETGLEATGNCRAEIALRCKGASPRGGGEGGRKGRRGKAGEKRKGMREGDGKDARSFSDLRPRVQDPRVALPRRAMCPRNLGC